MGLEIPGQLRYANDKADSSAEQVAVLCQLPPADAVRVLEVESLMHELVGLEGKPEQESRIQGR